MGRGAEFLALDRPLVIAHRGNSSAAPENTLPAFASALKLGVDGVELDFQQTRDGELIVVHDDTLTRTTDAAAALGRSDLPVAEALLAEIARLDAGAWFGPAFIGTPIPTLGEALRVIASRAVPVIEHKSGEAANCLELLESLGLLGDAVVMSFDWKFLAECRRGSTELALVALGDERLSTERLRAAQALGDAAVGWSDAQIDAATAALVRQQQLKLWVWTVDDAARARQLAAWGVGAIITNRPAEIIAALCD